MSLYVKDTYLNKNIQYLTNKEIIEYDIHHAGFNISKYFKLLSKEIIDELEYLPKEQLVVRLGLLQKEDKDYKNNLKEKFIETRKMFFEANNLIDEDILSIKKDAIVTLKRCPIVTFDNISFKEEIFSSYYFINKKEMYVGDGYISVKGISNDKLKLHENYMLAALYKLFKMLESTTDYNYIIKKFISFSDDYKNGLLDVHYYRELDEKSLYRIQDDLGFANDVENINDIDITYNYVKYIVPLLNLLI
jgi:hypothetical protein